VNNGWTPERRAKQAAAIHRWKPWQKAGVKTAAGKEISKKNSFKDGARAAKVRRLSKLLSDISTELAEHENGSYL